MIYSIGKNLGNKLTGIEQAMINRLKLFKDNLVPNKLIFTSWSPRLYMHAHSLNIDSKDIFSLYDFLQDSINFEKKHIDWINYWQNICNYTLKFVENTNDIKIYDNDTYKMYVHFVDSNYQTLDYINHFDIQQRKIRRDFYDTRGFLSCSRILTSQQKVVMEQFFTPTQKVKFQKYYNPEHEHPKVQSIIYNTSRGIRFFNDENELLAFAINALYHLGDVFLCDKNIVTGPIIDQTDTKIPVLAVFHSTHVKNINDIYHSEIKQAYKPVLDNLSRYSGIIVSTEQQKTDLSIKINNVIPIYVIPAGYIDTNESHHSNDNKPLPNKMISIGRYSPEKQLDHQIELMSKLVPAFPNLQLHLFGFGKEETHYRKLITQYHLENHVFLRGFIYDLNQEIETAYLSLLTSKMEGFNLGVLETIAKGVPTVSYDTKYGPSELIVNYKNGFLIEQDNKEQLYHSVKKLLLDSNLREQFSKESIKHAQIFNDKNVFNTWLTVFRTLKVNL